MRPEAGLSPAPRRADSASKSPSFRSSISLSAALCCISSSSLRALRSVRPSCSHPSHLDCTSRSHARRSPAFALRRPPSGIQSLRVRDGASAQRQPGDGSCDPPICQAPCSATSGAHTDRRRIAKWDAQGGGAYWKPPGPGRSSTVPPPRCSPPPSTPTLDPSQLGLCLQSFRLREAESRTLRQEMVPTMLPSTTTGLQQSLRLAPSVPRVTVQRATTVVRAAAQEESSAWRPGISKRSAHPKKVVLSQRERPQVRPTGVDWLMDGECGLSTRIKNPKRRAGTQ